MRSAFVKSIFAIFFVTALLVSFQNCKNLISQGGGEPYPGAPSSGELPLAYISENQVCGDSLSSDRIDVELGTQNFTEVRENCNNVNRTIPSGSLTWLIPDYSFSYNGKIYTR